MWRRRQSAFSFAVNSAFQDGVLTHLLDEQAKHAGELPFQPLTVRLFALELDERLAEERGSQAESSTAQQDTVALFSAAILAMRPTITLSAVEAATFLRNALLRCLSATNEAQLTAMLHLIGAMVNKRSPGPSSQILLLGRMGADGRPSRRYPRVLHRSSSRVLDRLHRRLVQVGCIAASSPARLGMGTLLSPAVAHQLTSIPPGRKGTRRSFRPAGLRGGREDP